MYAFMNNGGTRRTNNQLITRTDGWAKGWKKEEGGQNENGCILRTKFLNNLILKFNRISGTCNFDGGFCEWINLPLGDEFDWALNSGKTGTILTGPENDHTGHDGN